MTDPRAIVHHGDCLDVLAGLDPDSVDAIVTDPPYALGFMGEAWDTFDPPGGSASYGKKGAPGKTKSRGYADSNAAAFGAFCEEWARACLRVLKPGGHLLAFGGTRTWHRLACAVEDAGFELRDSIAWLYGQGFPKSLDVGKAIDRAAGAEREVVGVHPAPATPRVGTFNASFGEATLTAPATPDAAAWQGWGTALKPAHEPIVVARKPLVGTVAANVLAHGTGALNIDGCRIGTGEDVVTFDRAPRTEDGSVYDLGTVTSVRPSGQGRWPANVVLDEHAAAELDAQSGTSTSRRGTPRGTVAPGDGWGMTATGSEYDDAGGASRFFPVFRYAEKAPTRQRPRSRAGVSHATVKPLTLMRWLVRLVTPPGGVVLDPFAGSGTTLEAALVEGFDAVGIEREPSYLPLIAARLDRVRLRIPDDPDDTDPWAEHLDEPPDALQLW